MGLKYFDYSLVSLKEYITKQSSGVVFGSPNISLIIASLIIIAAAYFIAKKLYNVKPNYKHYDPREYHQKHKGFGGLLSIGITIVAYLIIVSCIHLYHSLYLYGTASWDFLTSSDFIDASPLWSLTIIYITLSNLTIFLYSILLLILIIKKKRIFKKLILIYIPLILIVHGGKYVLLSQILPVNHLIVYDSFLYFSFTLQVSLLALGYFAFSRRVNATFSN